MEARQLAKRPAVTCAPETTLTEAAQRMKTENVGSVLIVNDLGVVGIATDRDIVVRGLAEGLDPDEQLWKVMTKDVAYVYGDTDVVSAAKKMTARGCRRLLVLNPDDGIEGVIALDDLVMLFAGEIGSLAETVREELAVGTSA